MRGDLPPPTLTPQLLSQAMRSVRLFWCKKLSAGVSENFQIHFAWKLRPQLIADLIFFLPPATFSFSATSCHSWRSVYFHLHPAYSNDTEAVMCFDAHHLMFMLCSEGPTRRENEWRCDCSGSPHICGPALPHNHQFSSKWLFLNGSDENTVCLIIIHLALLSLSESL